MFRFIVLQSGGAPATIDAGNWLAFGDAILGEETRSPSIVYPPAVPLLTKGFVEVSGPVSGVAALGALSSIAPAAGFFAALWTLGYRICLLPGALLLIGASAVGEATAWGGFPQLIGLGLIPPILIMFDRWLSDPEVNTATALGLLIMGMLATSHFLGLATVVACGLLLVCRILQSRAPTQWSWRVSIGHIALLVGPSLWLAPLYLELLGTFTGQSSEFRALDQLEWSNVLERIEFLYRDFPYFWRVALPLSVATPVLLWRHRFSPAWRVLVVVITMSASMSIATRESRFLYFATLVVALAVTLWIDALSEWFREQRLWNHLRVYGPPILISMITALAVWQSAAGLGFFREQRDFYGILTAGLYESLVAVREETPPDAVLAVSSIRDAPVGWWVEAITDRSTYYASALRWLVYDDEIERARVANQLFTSSFPDEETLSVARAYGIDYLIVSKRWAYYDSETLDAQSVFSQNALYDVPDVLVTPVP